MYVLSYLKHVSSIICQSSLSIKIFQPPPKNTCVHNNTHSEMELRIDLVSSLEKGINELAMHLFYVSFIQFEDGTKRL